MLLRLPTDVLFKIASHVVAPDLVVAAGKNLEARTALRKGTDAAERSRFGGIGLTIRGGALRFVVPTCLTRIWRPATSRRDGRLASRSEGPFPIRTTSSP